jgi:hypothetical protein
MINVHCIISFIVVIIIIAISLSSVISDVNFHRHIRLHLLGRFSKSCDFDIAERLHVGTDEIIGARTLV